MQQKYLPVVTTLVMGHPESRPYHLALRFADNTYADLDISNLGVDCREVDLKSCKMRIYVRTEACDPRGADCVIITADLTDPDAPNKVRAYLQQVAKTASKKKIIIAGTKAEQAEKQTLITAAIQQIAQENNCKFFATSAKKGTNVRAVFEAAANAVLNPQQELRHEALPQLYQAQAAVRHQRAMKVGIVLAAIIFTPLSLLVTIPLYRRAQRNKDIHRVVTTTDEYAAVKAKRANWRDANSVDGELFKGKVVNKPKKLKDTATQPGKLVMYMDKHQYERYKLFRDKNDRDVIAPETITASQQRSADKIAPMQGKRI